MAAGRSRMLATAEVPYVGRSMDQLEVGSASPGCDRTCAMASMKLVLRLPVPRSSHRTSHLGCLAINTQIRVGACWRRV
jgi:hypothetical protein